MMMKFCSFSKVMARLMLGFEKPNAAATSTERTYPFFSSSIKMVSR